MTFRLRIDPDTLKKIQQLVEKGLYKDEYEFIIRAIKNQVQDDYQEDVESTVDHSMLFSQEIKPTHPDIPTFTFVELKEKLNDALKNVILKKYEKPKISLQESLYGPGAAGMIWMFHNRFLPVKIVLYQLAMLIAKHKSNWIELDDLKENASELASNISEQLYRIERPYGTIIPSTGLPASKSKIAERYYGKRYKEEKITSRISSSKKRFADQFVGRIVKKESKEVIFSGACYEMGLVSIEPSDNMWKVSLTENGKKFVSFSNPLLENILSSSRDYTPNLGQSIFSKEEVDFIRTKIYPIYELENEISNEILELKNKFNPEQVSNITRIQKATYNKSRYNNEELENIKKSYSLKEEQNVLNWIVERYLDFQPAIIVGRLLELGLLTKGMEGKNTFYQLA